MVPLSPTEDNISVLPLIPQSDLPTLAKMDKTSSREVAAPKHFFIIFQLCFLGYLRLFCIFNNKNPAYGRHRISRPMRIVAPIPQ